MNVTPPADCPAPRPLAVLPQPVPPRAALPPLAPRRSALTEALAGPTPPYALPPREPAAIQVSCPDLVLEAMACGRGLALAASRAKPATVAVAAALSLDLPATLPQSDEIPELCLLRDPRAFLAHPPGWRPLLEMHLQPAWLEPLLRQEVPPADQNAGFAQENRMRALARYLICLRVARIPRAAAQQLAALLPSLLALPSVECRHRLLTLLVAQSVKPARCADLLRAWQDAGAGDAKPLALACALVCPDLASLPAVRAVLESRAVVGNGVVARRVLAYLLRREFRHGDDVGRAVLTWVTDANLLRMLRLGIGRSKTHTTAAKLLDAQGACARGAVRVPWQEARATDMQQHDVLMALLADRRARQVASEHDAALVRVELERLQGAFAWLATQQAAAPLARACQEIQAGLAAEGPPAQAARAQRDLAIKTLNRLRNCVGGKKTPRSEWTRELLGQLEGCVRAWTALGAAAASSTPQPARPSPQAAFFAHKPVRTYVNQTLVPLLLAMQQHTPLLNALARHGQAVDLHGVSRPEQVVGLCVPWFKGRDTPLMERFLAEVKAPENLVAYAARSSTWTADYLARGLPTLERLVRATLDGSYAQLRSAAPQMRALRAQPQHHVALRRWEAGGSREIPACAGLGTWRVYDTADLGDTFDAMTQISSCQSPTDGWESYNVGNLGRLMDGSKRLIVLRDAKDRVRGRAIVRLMQDPHGAPVLTLSTLFATNHSQPSLRALIAYAAQRAAELDVKGVYTSFRLFGGKGLGAPWTQRLTSAHAALPDYYDELGGLIEEDAVLKPNHPMWTLLLER